MGTERTQQTHDTLQLTKRKVLVSWFKGDFQHNFRSSNHMRVNVYHFPNIKQIICEKRQFPCKKKKNAFTKVVSSQHSVLLFKNKSFWPPEISLTYQVSMKSMGGRWFKGWKLAFCCPLLTVMKHQVSFAFVYQDKKIKRRPALN